MQLPFASIPILPAEKEKNFFDLAQILGPLPKAWLFFHDNQKKLDKLRIVPYTICGAFAHLLGHRHRVLRAVRLGGTRHFSTVALVSFCLNADLTSPDLACLSPRACICRVALF